MENNKGTSLSLANIPLIMIIAYIFAALSIGEEFRNKTILAYIASGHDRHQVILTKYLIFILLSEILVIVPIFLNALIGAKLFSDHLLMPLPSAATSSSLI